MSHHNSPQPSSGTRAFMLPSPSGDALAAAVAAALESLNTTKLSARQLAKLAELLERQLSQPPEAALPDADRKRAIPRLTVEEIQLAALKHLCQTGSLPSSASREPAPSIPGCTWHSINNAAFYGLRGLPQSSLSAILAPLRIITEEELRSAALEYFQHTGRFPSAGSQGTVSGLPSETWRTMAHAMSSGRCLNSSAQGISEFMRPLRKQHNAPAQGVPPGTLRKPLLNEDSVRAAARDFFRLHGRLPTHHSREPIPSLPNETWPGINFAGQNGSRGLSEGRTVSKILAPLRAELGIDPPLSEAGIVAAAQEFHRLNGRLPNSGDSSQRPPGLPRDTWCILNHALSRGLRGLPGGTTLAKLLAPLRKELAPTGVQLTEEIIHAAAREYHRTHGRLPTNLSQEDLSGLSGITWLNVEYAARAGSRGLPGGSSLSRMLAPLRAELKSNTPRRKP